MSSIRLFIAITILVFGFIGCSSVNEPTSVEPSSKSSSNVLSNGAFTSSGEYEWDDFDCNGTPVHFTLTEHYMFQVTTNGAGQHVVKIKLNTNGSGVADDGTEYRLNDVGRTVESVQDDDCTVVSDVVISGTITTAGGGNNSRYTITGRFTYNFCDESAYFEVLSTDVECF